ncbi:MAG: transposase, partial [Flavobacteriaceae bacterium]|nr:transposase [Flavobacteriaceae bacterium]
EVFEKYLNEFSKHRPNEYKIVVIDNAGFHSTKNIKIPDNIYLLRIPHYTPELNPCEQVWKYIKDSYKNSCFDSLEKIKDWLHEFVKNMDENLIKSITSNYHYINAFMRNN